MLLVIRDNYSIGITTFNKRFEKFLKPLVVSIREKRPNIDIILAINSDYKIGMHEDYRKDILMFCASLPRIYPIMFSEMRGCSKMWNSMITNSTKDNMLILNDDIIINHSDFFNSLENKQAELFKINGSFSHFFINKTQMYDLGYFDERFLGFGEEDGDLVYRFIEKYNRNIPNINLPNIINVVDNSRDENIKCGIGKYSYFNREFAYNENGSYHECKYRESNESTISGMFGTPMKKTLPDLNSYPYEEFYLKNKNNL